MKLATILFLALFAQQEGVIVLSGGTVLTVTKGIIEDGVIVIRDGKIVSVGKDGEVDIPDGAKVIDTKGKYIMPGIIDAHSHMGVYPWPSFPSNRDGNEMTDPITPHVRAEDAVYTADPAFKRALAGGVTTVLIIPGSGNMIGGQGVVMKLRIGKSLDEMKFDGAPQHLKMASGENPKRVYGGKDKMPSTRMGNFAILREWFTKAQDYMKKWDRYEEKKDKDEDAEPLSFDARLDTLSRIIKGDIWVNIHCYRADEILTLIKISKEFGWKIKTLHHALDAYKIADMIAKEGIAVATFVDWWGYKVEAWDGNPYALPILTKKGVLTVLKSDSADMVQRMYHEAAKAVKYGVEPEEALKLITINPAVALGISERVGSIEEGKDADIAIFSKHPFDIYTLCEMTLLDGKVVFDRENNGDYWGDIIND